ncbi:MAG: hypothetical protein FJZ58_07130 [Chlamydiae bacterium]|nr:hypothetical protein [Chlamydiota bacterium]
MTLTVEPFLDIRLEGQEDPLQDPMKIAYIHSGIRKLLLGKEGGNITSPHVGLFPLEQDFLYRIMLVCPHSSGVESFFYAMITRWLLPRRKLELLSFSYDRFTVSPGEEESLVFCEARFACLDSWEEELLLEAFTRVEAELCLGACSPHHGHRILELKEVLSTEKTFSLYEKLSQLLHRRPMVFEGDLFAFMQHLLLPCSEEFFSIRETHHLARIVSVLYLFQKMLVRATEGESVDRHVFCKVQRVRLHLPFGVSRVLGVFVGMQFFSSHELFEEQHLLQALQEWFPQCKLVEGSKIIYRKKEEKLQLIYIEIEQTESFSFEGIRHLQQGVVQELGRQVEKLMPALFMPRNEEEVLKNILLLSRQLHYVRDLPQGFISFEEQTEQELIFTVILLRVLRSQKEPSMRELFQETSPWIAFLEDRVKKVGMLRGRYEKEATVFRLTVPKVRYMRKDHSVDLLRARQEIVQEIQGKVGEFRDYNGGMISHQMQNLYALRKACSLLPGEDVELENFFHCLFPVEMRSVAPPLLIKAFYELWKRRQKGRSLVRREPGALLVMMHCQEARLGAELTKYIKELQLSSSQVLTCSYKEGKELYLGYLFQVLTQEKEEKILQQLGKIEGNVLDSREKQGVTRYA